MMNANWAYFLGCMGGVFEGTFRGDPKFEKLFKILDSEKPMSKKDEDKVARIVMIMGGYMQDGFYSDEIGPRMEDGEDGGKRK